MSRTTSCPSAAILGQPLSEEASPELREHLASCARCRDQRAALAGVVDLVRDLPVRDLTSARHAAVRSRLVIGAAAIATTRTDTGRGRTVRWAGAAMAALLLLCLAVLTLRREASPTEEPVHRAAVHGAASARFVRLGAQPDEVVRLFDGTLTVEVETLREGERFRVVVGDGAVEVRGTAFEVKAARDQLVEVSVTHGRVEVTKDGEEPSILVAGDRWVASPPPAPVASAPSAARVLAEPLLELAPPSSVPPWRVSRQLPQPSELPIAAAPASASVSASGSGSASVTAPPASASAAGPSRPVQPSAAEIAFQQGVAALRAGDAKKAAAAFATVPRDSSVAEEASFLRGIALSRGGEPLRAIPVLTSFLERFPSSRRRGEASVALGWLLVERGHKQAAEAAFREGAKDVDDGVRHAAEAGLAHVAGKAAHDAP